MKHEFDWLANWATYTPEKTALKSADTGQIFTYKDLYEKMNEYVLSYKTNEDRLAADFHCIFNLAVFCFARLRQMAQQSGNEAFVYNDALRRIIDKGLKLGNDEIILNGKYYGEICQQEVM